MSSLEDCCLHVCGPLHRGAQAPVARPFAIVGDRRRAYQRRPIIGRLLDCRPCHCSMLRGNLVNPLTSLADRRRVTSAHTVVFQSKSGHRCTERHTLDHFASGLQCLPPRQEEDEADRAAQQLADIDLDELLSSDEDEGPAAATTPQLAPEGLHPVPHSPRQANLPVLHRNHCAPLPVVRPCPPTDGCRMRRKRAQIISMGSSTSRREVAIAARRVRARAMPCTVL